MTEPTKNDRALRIHNAMVDWSRSRDIELDDEANEEELANFLADIRHYAAENGLDFYTALRQSHGMWEWDNDQESE